ncbi:MAG: LysR family transcriptional regulator [Lautropia sp.]
MNLRQLEVFFAIMRTGSVTGAARSLNVTQPAISNVLRHAEQQLRFKLFERIAGRLQPTPEALDLLPDVQEIFGRIGTLNRTVDEMREGRYGRLAIVASPTLVNAFLPRALARMQQPGAAMQFIVQALPTSIAIERIARREADIGVIYAPVADPGVVAEEIATSEVACAVRADSHLAGKRVIASSDLEDVPVISTGSSTRIGTFIEERCRAAGLTPPVIAIEANSSFTACLMASAGVGVALVDRATAVSDKFPELVFVRFKPHVALKLALIHPKDRPRSRAASRFAEHLRAEVSKTA